MSNGLHSVPAGGSAIVLGASGGLGTALSDAIARSGRFERLVKLSRASVPAIELLDEASLARAAKYASGVGAVRLVVDATGFLHDDRHKPEKSWRDLEPDDMGRAFALNAIGPVLIMKHFLPLFPPSGKAVFATLSARVGSIGDNHLGGWYSYRASKAALNQLVRTASVELKRLKPEAVCVALHPGTVDTPLSQPFSRAGLEVHSPSIAAAHLISVIDRLGPDESGGFFDWHGASVPW